MGKEKETFERWRQPKRATKVGTRANPSADPATSPKTTRGKNVDRGGKALGMKSTALQKDVGEVPSPGSRPEGGGMSVVHFREHMLLQPYAPKYCPCSYNLQRSVRYQSEGTFTSRVFVWCIECKHIILEILSCLYQLQEEGVTFIIKLMEGQSEVVV